jgi:hypothetical protein
MARCCEICENLELTAAPTRRLRRLLIENRVVSLCAEHALALAEQRPESLSQLAELFKEDGGARSLLPRRAPLERRQFPPRPEGRRRGGGRRAGDAG